MEDYDSALTWKEVGLFQTPTLLVVCPCPALSIRLPMCLEWVQVSPHIRPCFLYSVHQFCPLEIHSASWNFVNKRNIVFDLWVSLASCHHALTLQGPIPHADSPTVPGSRKIYSCFTLYFSLLLSLELFLEKILTFSLLMIHPNHVVIARILRQ
jgi:hypothetical protein